MPDMSGKDAEHVTAAYQDVSIRTSDFASHRVPVQRIHDVAEELTALLGSSRTLLIDAAGPDERYQLPNRTNRLFWRNWQAADPAGSGTPVDEELSFDLVVCTDHELLLDDVTLTALCKWISGCSDQIVVLFPGADLGDAAMGHPRWAAALAKHDFVRIFDDVPSALAVARFEKNHPPTAAHVIEVYEGALAARAVQVKAAQLPEDLLIGGVEQQQRQLVAARRDAMRERDRALGMMARLLSLQYEADFWQLEAQRKVRAARRDRAKLDAVLVGPRYRIGSFVLLPVRAVRAVVRKLKGSVKTA